MFINASSHQDRLLTALPSGHTMAETTGVTVETTGARAVLTGARIARSIFGLAILGE